MEQDPEGSPCWEVNIIQATFLQDRYTLHIILQPASFIEQHICEHILLTWDRFANTTDWVQHNLCSHFPMAGHLNGSWLFVSPNLSATKLPCFHIFVAASYFLRLHACAHAQSPQLRLTLCDPMDCSPPGSSVHRILQAKMSGLPCLPPGDLPNPGIETTSPTSLALQGDF